MVYFILVASQKGGVGKSALSQLIATGYANNGYSVLLADMDRQQQSSVLWDTWRSGNNLPEKVKVKSFGDVTDVLKVSSEYGLVVFDGAPHATIQTLEMAKLSNMIILPTPACKVDMEPQVK